jgi:hypothetical protein
VPLAAVMAGETALEQVVASVEAQTRSKGTFAIAVVGAVTVTVGTGGAGGGGGGVCGGGGGTGVDAGASSPLEPEPPQPVRIKSAESGIAINGYFTVVSLTVYLIRIIGNGSEAVALADSCCRRVLQLLLFLIYFCLLVIGFILCTLDLLHFFLYL